MDATLTVSLPLNGVSFMHPGDRESNDLDPDTVDEALEVFLAESTELAASDRQDVVDLLMAYSAGDFDIDGRNA